MTTTTAAPITLDWGRSAIHTASGVRGFYTIHSTTDGATLVVNDYQGDGYAEPVTLAKNITLPAARKRAQRYDRGES